MVKEMTGAFIGHGLQENKTYVEFLPENETEETTYQVAAHLAQEVSQLQMPCPVNITLENTTVTDIEVIPASPRAEMNL